MHMHAAAAAAAVRTGVVMVSNCYRESVNQVVEISKVKQST